MESSPSSKKFWYLIYCKPRQERLAQENLERQSFETYLPLVRQMRRRAYRRIATVEPLFPRYLFVHLDAEKDDWGSIRSTIGVISLVRFGAQPAQVPDTLISELQAHDAPDGIQNLARPGFQKGQQVLVEEGLLAGHEGIWLTSNGKERAHILLEIMGKQIKTEVNENWLKRLEP
ncbi:transcription/translation regulatory transformer protein RfaH [Nitrosococcus watsonii]|uniref:Transcription antitermination protein RfaH n=1 Tax=Nitrosococcus watsoni (strain C-113) TaxID=105559 RepID=D8KB72_NITWC|nr:transcription/translation regulatory transformer protein RfaH [Nitrosococcus watsonii]ADJ27606.1 NusG antitermination factor [Nitrosococcus watsonii C-113]